MAGWLDELFTGKNKSQAPPGLLDMLAELYPVEATGRAPIPTANSPFEAGAPPAAPLYSPSPMVTGNPFGMPAIAPPLPPPIDVGRAPQPPAELPSSPSLSAIPPDAQASAEPPTGAVSPVAAMAPPSGAAPFFPGQDVLARIGHHVLQGLRDNSAGLIAGGGAMISGGLGHGLSAMAAATPLDIAARKERQGNEAIAATYDALRKQGFSDAEALAGSQNKEILKTMMEPTVLQGPKDMFGNQPAVVRVGGKLIPWDQAVSGARSVGAGGPGVASFDPSKFDQNLVGEDFLKQFPPTIQAAIRDYHQSMVMPSGNPRLGTPLMIKTFAEKYGRDIGVPVDEAAFAERKKMLLDLEASSPQSLGGQRTNANAALKHLAEAGGYAAQLGNTGLGNTYAPAARAINTIKNQFGENASTAAALEDVARRYGGEVTKFMTGGPGTEGERLHFVTALGTAATPLELAKVLTAERDTLMEKLVSTQDKIERTMSKQALALHPEKLRMIEPETQKAIEKLDRHIAVLRGEAKAGPEPVRVQSVAEARKLPKGTPIILPDGSPGVVP